MNLGQLIDMLEMMPDKTRVVPKGFKNPHSWRGVYAELAFEPANNVSIDDMLKAAHAANGATYCGWKGGDYRMDRDTEIHLSIPGESYDYFGEYVAFYFCGQKTTVCCEDCGERVLEPLAENHSRVKCLEVQLIIAKEQEDRRKAMRST